MIIGQDLLRELGVIIDFQRETMSWDGSTIEMSRVPTREYNEAGTQINEPHVHEPTSTREIRS